MSVAVALGLQCAGVELARDDGVQVGFIGLIISGIVAAFGWIADKAVTIGAVLWQVAVIVGKALAHFAINLGHVFAKVYQLFEKFWAHVLRPFVEWSWTEVQRLSAWLKDLFAPALQFLERVRVEIFKLYDKFLKPVLDTIEAIRGILRILSTFQVEWARKLDQALAELEARIMAPLQFILGKVNELTNWINRIVTLDGLFQRVTLIRSLLVYQKDALGVWWQSIHRGLTPGEDEIYRQPLPSRTIAAIDLDTRRYILSHSGPDVERIDEHVADLRLRVG